MRQRGLVHGLAWTLATGAAVTLSWWGVHTVMSGTAYDRPRAVPLAGGSDGSPAQGASPRASSTHRPRATPEPEPERSGSGGSGESGGSSGSSSSGGGSSSPDRPSAPANSPDPGEGAPSGDVKSYTVAGGRVVFEMGRSSAELVSATPDSGWQMQVWKQERWIRVTFTQGGREVSVFCTWHDHAPRVQVDER
ncbi:hypothetical protein QIS99_12290 [Streptomyces sp. B-S-A8]|uniref:Secreted protein n=1 Tax=Streptomyces solicavernae TaxID=3043614 RepID=A0ABT6RRA6_9ACTN|nr:hypothetical protein [Streptomyces sp. B-S-A8]MDI3386972.1 hypothetical protein [Streptomyces sp. B-S-A8]